jgi:hypothetical protein
MSLNESILLELVDNYGVNGQVDLTFIRRLYQLRFSRWLNFKGNLRDAVKSITDASSTLDLLQKGFSCFLTRKATPKCSQDAPRALTDDSPILDKTELPWNEAVLTEFISMHGVNGVLDISLLPDLYKRRYNHPLPAPGNVGDAVKRVTDASSTLGLLQRGFSCFLTRKAALVQVSPVLSSRFFGPNSSIGIAPIQNSTMFWNEIVLLELVDSYGVNGQIDSTLIPEIYKMHFHRPVPISGEIVLAIKFITDSSSALDFIQDDNRWFLRRRMSSTQEPLTAMTPMISSSSDKNAKIASLYLEMDASLLSYNQSKTEFTLRISALERELNEERVKAAREAASFQKDYEKLQGVAAQTRELLDQKDAELKSSQIALADRSNDLASLRAQIQKLDKDLSEARNLNIELRDKADNYLRQKEAAEALVLKLQSDIDRMESVMDDFDFL